MGGTSSVGEGQLGVEAFCARVQTAKRGSVTREPAAAHLPDRLARAMNELDWMWKELALAEEELQQQNEELIASRTLLEAERQRYRELFDFAPDAYVVTDRHGIMRSANRAAAELLRTDLAALIGKPLITFVCTEHRASFRLCLARLPQLQRMCDLDLRLQPRQRAPLPAQISVGLMPGGAEGAPGELLWSIRDASERLRLEAELRERRDDVRRLQESER
jgi:two-component system cell cycle sensor histidine kinase/response regulator CckA